MVVHSLCPYVCPNIGSVPSFFQGGLLDLWKEEIFVFLQDLWNNYKIFI
jgi:hypothetical protein